jgi:hypothetical protein
VLEGAAGAGGGEVRQVSRDLVRKCPLPAVEFGLYLEKKGNC